MQVLVARQGLGNMAVSNAFGSNTFNIFIALGFPWLIGTLIRPNCRVEANYGDDPGELEPVRVCAAPLCLFRSTAAAAA